LLEEHFEHLDEVMQGNGSPDGVFEVDEIGSLATEGFCVRDIFVPGTLKLSDGDGHGSVSLT
jgi:hypothetical protein